ncbi:White collar-1 protein light receptor [Podospora pseudocomata]|uniref:White collar-1 protein light receptor n=1 Tax=Podospora pseudocomata TaxID=2093779 RepID=A0ABR0GBV0_9PEZI|nr:White collar-1 protein light receptor [Podospora pseudocomata]
MNNNNFYTTQLAQEEAQRRGQQQNAGRNLGMISTTGLSGVSDSLDEIVRQNNNELQRRRRSIPQSFQGGAMLTTDADRRLSMMDFGSPDHYQDFQFGNMNSPQMAGFGAMPTSMPGSSGPYSQPGLMAMSDQNDFASLSPDIMGNMMAFSSLNMEAMGTDPASLNLFNSPGLGHQYPPTTMDSVTPDFSMDMGMGTTPLTLTSDDMSGVEDAFGNRPQQRPHNLTLDSQMNQFQPSMPPPLTREISGTTAYRSPASGTSHTLSGMGAAQPSAVATVSTPQTPATTVGPALPDSLHASKEKSIYSKSGFDMLRALWYVATRKNAQLQIGAVDMSCAFVVCDVELQDCPIIYVSDNFQNLTGYVRHEIVGQNCRFLQSPTGKVEAGTKREFVENHAVFKLKNAIAEGREIQQSLINYRKGGKPFLNLLTMIPIPWDDPNTIRYFIGFQIDLVECPDAISGQESGGAMHVNYVHSDIGQYIWTPPSSTQWEPENGQTLAIDDVSSLLQQFNPKGAVSDWHRQSWDKMLLENADDVVHVLSLKGLFLYLSPSCKKILEYDTNDLMGNSLASICHPSDIVPVTRELKEAQANVPVNIVFRIRRKNSGYTWFESHGTLFSEQGKGRKCIILVGRKRPIFALSKRNLDQHGGIGDSEIWSKVSTSGMFLYVASNVRSLLDLERKDLEGTSMQDLMRKESRVEFGRTIEKSRRGKIASCKHEIQNKRGQVLQAHTTFYPGDAEEGQKPTFLLAQTKLLKASSRAIAPAGKTGASVASVSDDGQQMTGIVMGHTKTISTEGALFSQPAGQLIGGTQDIALASDDNIFDELKTTRCTSWQYELRQMEKVNRLLAEELAQLLSNRKKRKRRKGGGNMVRDCANCHTRNTPEWRRGPSGQRDLCNSCGLRWAKQRDAQTGRVSPRNSNRGGDAQSKKSNSPSHASPLQREVSSNSTKPATTDTPPTEPGSKSTTATPTNVLTPSDNGSSGFPTPTAGGNGSSKTGATSSASPDIKSENGGGGPPQSQPMLEGGSGLGGSGMEMTSIREEREMSA